MKYAEIWMCPHHVYLQGVDAFGRVDEIKRMADIAGVKIACVCPEQNNPKPNNLAAKDIEIMRNSLSYFERIIFAAKLLESDKVLMTSGWAFYDEDKDLAWERSVNNMRRISEYAKRLNVKICVEPLQPQESILVNNIQTMKKYLDEVNSDNVYVALDLGALGKANESIKQWFDQFGHRIIHIHYVDGNPTGHLPIGMGSRNVEEDLRIIDSYGYKGVLSFEFANGVAFNEPSKIDNDSIRYIKEIEERRMNHD